MIPNCVYGNWKMNVTNSQIREYMDLFSSIDFSRLYPDIEVVIFPSFVGLKTAIETRKTDKLQIGAQDVHPYNSGSYTGQISCAMLKEFGIRHVFVGMNEQKTHLKYTLEDCTKKIQQILANNMIPVYFVGETLAEREKGETRAVIESQLNAVSSVISAGTNIRFVYEPVWAIGTGKTCSPQQAQEVYEIIKNFIAAKWDLGYSDSVPILYGGSVNSGNVREFRATRYNGVCCGGASLKPAFIDILFGYGSH